MLAGEANCLCAVIVVVIIVCLWSFSALIWNKKLKLDFSPGTTRQCCKDVQWRNVSAVLFMSSCVEKWLHDGWFMLLLRGKWSKNSLKFLWIGSLESSKQRALSARIWQHWLLHNVPFKNRIPKVVCVHCNKCNLKRESCDFFSFSAHCLVHSVGIWSTYTTPRASSVCFTS